MGDTHSELKMFYFHIPKTGGQTLATRLASAFPAEKSSIMGPDLIAPDGAAELRALLNEYYFVERHVNGPALKDIHDVAILATFRDPVRQIVSNYLHIVREPRNNLHRAATTLAPREFFERFGDVLANCQARNVVNAFHEYQPLEEPLEYYVTHSLKDLARIRWVVPTRCIDEFTFLWALEMGRDVPLNTLRVNTAPKDGQSEELYQLVRNYPDLYSIDLVLWQRVLRRFDDYRDQVRQTLLPFNAPHDSTRAYWKDGEGIWLTRGWHMPQNTPQGMEWWAGPGTFSQVKYRRVPDHTYLHFSVIVLCGIKPQQILATTPDKVTRLPTMTREQGARLLFWVDLAGLPEEGSLWLNVPQTLAPIVVDSVDTEMTRKSYATCDWGFSAPWV